MPIPTVRPNEQEKKFIARCLSDPTMVAEYEQKVRAGICYSQWRKSKGIKESLKQGASGDIILANTGQLISDGYSKEVAEIIAEFYANGEY